MQNKLKEHVGEATAQSAGLMVFFLKALAITLHYSRDNFANDKDKHIPTI